MRIAHLGMQEAFDRIKKVAKKDLILCYVIAHCYVCQSDSNLKQPTSHSIFWP